MKQFSAMIAVISIMVSESAYTQDYGTPGDFLIELPPNAQAQAIGGGPVAGSVRTDAILANPAGLDYLTNMEISLYYLRIAESFHYYNIPFAYPFGKFGTIGISLTGIASKDVPRYNSFGIQTEGTYRNSDNVFTLCYSKRIGKIVAAGVNFKMASKQIESESGIGAGFDIGGIIVPLPWLRAGLSLTNIAGPTITLVSIPESYTTSFKFGVATNFINDQLHLNIDMALLDIVTKSDSYAPGKRPEQPLRWSAGVDYLLLPFVSLRAGVNDRYINLGVGFRIRNLYPDFALSYSTDNSELNPGFNYGFSFAAQFGKPIPKIEEDLARKEFEVNQKASLQKGQCLYLTGKPKEARPLVYAYTESHPEDHDAVELLREIDKKLAGGEIVALLEMAEKELASRNIEKTEALIAEALRIQSDNVDAQKIKDRLVIIKETEKHLKTIAALYAQKQYNEMLKEIEVVLQIDSANSDAKDYREKISAFTKRQEADQYYNLASQYYYEKKDIENANSALQKALALVPDHKDARALYEKLSAEIKEMYLKKVGQMVDAQGLKVDNENLKKLIENDMTDKIVNAQKLVDNKQFDQAVTLIESILRDKPEDTQVKELRAIAMKGINAQKSEMLYAEAVKFFNMQNYKESAAQIEEVLILVPDNAKAKEFLDEIKIKQREGNLTSAQMLMKSGKKADLDSAEILVRSYIEVNVSKDEATILLKSVQIEKLLVEANGLIEVGDFEKADMILQNAIKIDPDNKKVQDSFKNLKEAIDILKD